MYEFIKTDAQALRDELRALRREFHRYAEPGWMEMRTASRIARELKDMGYEEILLGRAVCLDAARMGVPDRAALDEHYRWAEENGADGFFLPYTAGGFTEKRIFVVGNVRHSVTFDKGQMNVVGIKCDGGCTFEKSDVLSSG